MSLTFHFSHRLALAIGFLLVCAGCDNLFRDEPDPLGIPVTRILGFRLDPNPVPMGDTLRVTCVVEDSLRTDLTYNWSGLGANVTTFTNKAALVAGFEPGVYLAGVGISSSSGDGYRVTGRFEVVIGPPKNQ